ncbi:hypothetical protein DPMN_105971 [Dreissena polymorpha]|uniref:Uncharacterized protein n=1 Tax=Dreissena polymorpha TaxID=45954 RepID=A0A9D4QHY9_DREPO|nr:hypothetical protein DPMN_105971 [Dreissena polymorpha]
MRFRAQHKTTKALIGRSVDGTSFDVIVSLAFGDERVNKEWISSRGRYVVDLAAEEERPVVLVDEDRVLLLAAEEERPVVLVDEERVLRLAAEEERPVVLDDEERVLVLAAEEELPVVLVDVERVLLLAADESAR